LDWDAASIELPLARFGMSPAEERVAAAAQTVAFARCILGTAQVSDGELEAAAALLTDESPEAYWLYGWWDAPYIAANGLSAGGLYFNLGTTLEFDDAQGTACVAAADVAQYRLYSTRTVTDGVGVLAAYSYQAFADAMGTHQISVLLGLQAQCIVDKGYDLDEDAAFPVAYIDESWDSATVLQAILDTATCNDDLRVTQRAGDINATYEQRIIDEHQAELQAIRSEIDATLEHAHALLREVGLE
jgi:hypothetical protein